MADQTSSYYRTFLRSNVLSIIARWRNHGCSDIILLPHIIMRPELPTAFAHLEPIRKSGRMVYMKTQESKKRTRARTPKNHTTTGYRVSDALWDVLEPLIPKRENTHRFGGGRPRVSDRRCADAIFYVLRTGCQWAALNDTELCAKSTAHDRFQEWVQADVFLNLWKAGVERFDDLCGIDWNWLSMDGAMTKAPLGGGKRPGQILQIGGKKG
jgi:transposase